MTQNYLFCTNIYCLVFKLQPYYKWYVVFCFQLFRIRIYNTAIDRNPVYLPRINVHHCIIMYIHTYTLVVNFTITFPCLCHSRYSCNSPFNSKFSKYIKPHLLRLFNLFCRSFFSLQILLFSILFCEPICCRVTCAQLRR